MNRSIIIILQLFGLLSSWFGAFYLGASRYVKKSPISKRSAVSGSSNDMLKSISSSRRKTEASSLLLRNEICTSSIEETERHMFTVTFESIRKDEADVTDVFQKILFHEGWANHILSYHCVDSYVATAMISCTAILEGGGHLFVDWFTPFERMDFEMYSGCGLLWKRENTQVSDVTELVRMLTSLVYNVTATTNAEEDDLINALLMKDVKFSHQLRLY
jgi:hypothetical protein